MFNSKATGKGALVIPEEEEIPESDEEEEKIPVKARKNAGRKSPWSQHQLDDFVDIIVGNEDYKKKLIFRNTKFQRNGELYGKIKLELEERCVARGENVSFSVDQLRSKFKKCVGECKRVALTIKTATGIKRFLDDKGYGTWFDKLFAIVKSRDSCQPDQALEPSTLEFVQNEGESSSGTDKILETESEDKPGKLFVPRKEHKRSRKDDPVCEAIKLMRSVVENDPTKEVINFLKEDIQKAREHELKLFQMMFSHGNSQGHSVPSNDFHPYTYGNQHSYQEYPLQQQYLFSHTSSALSQPTSVLSNDSTSSSAPSHDMSSGNTFYQSILN